METVRRRQIPYKPSGPNPWMIIGWITLGMILAAGVVLMLFFVAIASLVAG